MNKGEFGGVFFYIKNCGVFLKILYMCVFFYYYFIGDVVEKVF